MDLKKLCVLNVETKIWSILMILKSSATIVVINIQLEMNEMTKEEIGQWLADEIKGSVSETYRMFRKEGLLAKDAIYWARIVVQCGVNQLVESNFHSHIPGGIK